MAEADEEAIRRAFDVWLLEPVVLEAGFGQIDAIFSSFFTDIVIIWYVSYACTSFRARHFRFPFSPVLLVA